MGNISEHEEFVASLRDLADWYEARPTLELPTDTRFDVFPARDDLKRIARLFGSCRKESSTAFFSLQKRFGKKITLEASWYREQVCERVVVGTETVEEPIVVTQGYKTVTREKFEWRCPDILKPERQSSETETDVS